GSFWLGAGWPAGGLVVAGRGDGEFADEFGGGGVDDADVQVGDEHQDAGAGGGAADGGGGEPAGGAGGEAAGGVGGRVAAVVGGGGEAVVGVGAAVAGGGFGPGGVGGGGGGPVRQGAVRAAGVVDGGERVQQGLELAEGGGLPRLGAEPVLECLLESFDLPLG